jgi:ABC-type dipeptide/oligopeptide/nickel transport system ATPase component
MPLTIDKENIDKELLAFCNLIKRRLRQDWDIVLAITGEEGSGKSTLGMLIAGLIDNRFDFEKNVSYLPEAEEVKKQFTSLKRYQCYVIDEAIRALYKMNFMSNLQQTLVQMWATERFQNKATIMIIPRFRDLTENFRNHRVKIWIHVISRGQAVVYIRDDDPHNSDPWLFDYMQKYKQKAFGRRNIATIDIAARLKIERRMRNYLFEFDFPDLDPIDKNTYNYQKHQSRIRYMEEEKVNKKTSQGKMATQYRDARDLLIWNIVNKYGAGKKTALMEEMCESLNLTKASYKKILKKIDGVKQEEMDREERINSYVGVDRFLDQALQHEKNKNEYPSKSNKGSWKDISI